jgi:hypothetical protein
VRLSPQRLEQQHEFFGEHRKYALNISFSASSPGSAIAVNQLSHAASRICPAGFVRLKKWFLRRPIWFLWNRPRETASRNRERFSPLRCAGALPAAYLKTSQTV